MCMMRVLLLLSLGAGTHGFSLSPNRLPHRLLVSDLKPARTGSAACLVTEDDVEIAVEVAEKLWAEALTARETADRLSSEAENLCEAGEVGATAAAESMGGEAVKFKLSMLGDAQAAMSASLDAGKILSDAFEANEEADKLEELAEAALAASERAIEQHLLDFPDSELADKL